MIKSSALIYLIKYTLSSLLGVAFDFLIYLALIHNGFLQPGLANIISCPVGAAIGWVFAGKTLFHSHHIYMRGYLVWMTYLLAVIIASSILIQCLAALGLDKYLAKVIIIGLAFCCNSVFFKYGILQRYGR